MKRSGRYDVCVVGGSIAGATLAAHLAGEGFSVVLVERRELSEPKLCAELTHARLLDRVRALTGVSLPTGLVRAKLDHVEVVAGRHRLSRAFEAGLGITLDRLRLEEAVTARARELGARVLRPARAVDVGVDASGVVVDVEPQGRLAAELVVGADGAASLVGRKLVGPWRREAVGVACHVVLPIAPERAPCGASSVRFTLLDDAAGYSWVVPYGDAVGVGVGVQGEPIGDRFTRLLDSVGREVGEDLAAMAEGRTRRAPVPARGPERLTWGPRFLLVGDAGGFVSPASGEGMSLALSSVEAAASAIKLGFAAGDGRLVTRRLAAFERMWRKTAPDYQGLLRLRDAMAGPAASCWLDACRDDAERLLLVAPLVGAPDPERLALALLDRLRQASAGAG